MKQFSLNSSALARHEHERNSQGSERDTQRLHSKSVVSQTRKRPLVNTIKLNKFAAREGLQFIVKVERDMKSVLGQRGKSDIKFSKAPTSTRDIARENVRLKTPLITQRVRKDESLTSQHR